MLKKFPQLYFYQKLWCWQNTVLPNSVFSSDLTLQQIIINKHENKFETLKLCIYFISWYKNMEYTH
jgi:hypothetical protein